MTHAHPPEGQPIRAPRWTARPIRLGRRRSHGEGIHRQRNKAPAVATLDRIGELVVVGVEQISALATVAAGIGQRPDPDRLDHCCVVALVPQTGRARLGQQTLGVVVADGAYATPA